MTVVSPSQLRGASSDKRGIDPRSVVVNGHDDPIVLLRQGDS